MAIGALVVAVAYVLLAAVTALAGDTSVGWAWLVAFLVILTFGELYILPTGLGLFAKLAPTRLGAPTAASSLHPIFRGSLLAGGGGLLLRSEERRVGNGAGSTCR